MDEHYEVLPFQVPWLKMKPSDYFRRQCFISFEADETRLGQVIESIGADHVVFASDYPHWDATFPGVTDMILNRKDLGRRNPAKNHGRKCGKVVEVGLSRTRFWFRVVMFSRERWKPRLETRTLQEELWQTHRNSFPRWAAPSSIRFSCAITI